MLAAVGLLLLTGSKSLQNGDVGESGRGNTPSDAHDVWPPQSDDGYLCSDSLRPNNEAFRSAIADIRRRMRTVLGAQVSVQSSRDRHSGLLTSSATKEFAGALEVSLAAAARAHPQFHNWRRRPGSGKTASGSSDLHRAVLAWLGRPSEPRLRASRRG
jgi:hypothetical protein